MLFQLTKHADLNINRHIDWLPLVLHDDFLNPNYLTVRLIDTIEILNTYEVLEKIIVTQYK